MPLDADDRAVGREDVEIIALADRVPGIVRNRLHRKELHYFDHLKLNRISDAQIDTYGDLDELNSILGGLAARPDRRGCRRCR